MRLVPTQYIKRLPDDPEGRVAYGAEGCNGRFIADNPFVPGARLVIIGTNDDWEHVSVSCRKRCPTWQEMQWVKEQFWFDDEVAIQYHPAKSDYVNHHPYTLHMWRPKHLNVPMPPKELV
jgi:hypothetical protein